MNEAPVTSRLTYLFVYLGLLVLLAATVGAAYLPLGVFHTVVSVGIALAKAVLVGLFFMHLRHSLGSTRVLLGVSIFLLLVLMAITMADYLTRTNGLPFIG